MSMAEKVKSWFAPHKPLPPEMLHYQTPPDAPQQYRIHLRIEDDGRGLLIVNASTVLHLNQVAAEYARLMIQGASKDQAAHSVARRYHVSRDLAGEDYARLREHVLTLATTPDLCPVTYLDMERATPFSAATSAPYRADLALTYRIDPSGAQDPNARRRVDRELDTTEWKQILQTLWDAGVPHVCFTGGEPLLRPDLVELVLQAEKQGMVSGLLTNGHGLQDWNLFDQLLLAGLDHVQVTLTSHQPEQHDALVGQEGAWRMIDAGLHNAVEADIYVVAHLLVRPENAADVVETVSYLAQVGVHALALSSPLRSASETERSLLEQALEDAQNAAYARGLTVVMDLAAPYSHFNPVEVESELDPEQVIRQHLYVEPDGDALPAQGYNVVLGNLLRDPWESIWHHPEREKLGETG
ncbi:MAG: radical SAM protein [Anaerolineae bacterium]|nr:radical SAM protein [Anaerolineae bacterium]